MKTTVIDGRPIDYDITEPAAGAPEGPALLLLSGWCQDHRLFDLVLPLLARDHRVIRADWRSHGSDRTLEGDFGVAEQASDVIALLDELGVERVVPVSTSHGGWANLEICGRLGTGRVPRAVVIDWLLTRPAPEFAEGLRLGADPERWREGRQGLFDTWLAMADCPPVKRHLDEEMAGFDPELWRLSCRVIADAYATHGSPLERMREIGPRPIAHLFSQPGEESYLRAQEEFAARDPWFEPHRLGGRTHFPTLESPEAVAERVTAFVAAGER
ncbi:alpha/beta fold hydrolase [Bailinhaonella thermotolerans]|uniref:Alpha/beta fold hydrolase n=1 Tax=Bailinhaonella thermotolerans TaxID=1070861 RepID=A0A3A4AUS4_9ACTN|nr:alpha/beta hydrolase [Bailinhaonella thermotolerans]RJL33970.1 alpha/beta fold hydrolase [Bailinhaonella thermotolerans]